MAHGDGFSRNGKGDRRTLCFPPGPFSEDCSRSLSVDTMASSQCEAAVPGCLKRADYAGFLFGCRDRAADTDRLERFLSPVPEQMLRRGGRSNCGGAASALVLPAAAVLFARVVMHNGLACQWRGHRPRRL